MIRLWALSLSLCFPLAAEIVALPPSTFCGDVPVFCYGDPGECKGLFNSDGEIVREFRLPYKILGPYSEGLLAVVDPISGLTGYLDAEGRWALKPQWQKAYPFASGRARFCEGDLCGFIDKSGAVVIEPRFSARQRQIEDFDSDGYARFYVGNAYKDSSRRVGVIDTEGRVIIKPKLYAMGEFSEGVAPAVFEGPCWQEGPVGDMGPSIDVLGSSATASWLEDVERLAISHCRWSLVDSSGEPVSDRQYLAIEPFSEGLAAARAGDYWGFIDRTGQFQVQPTSHIAGRHTGNSLEESMGSPFFLVGPFSEGLAAIYSSDSGWLYVDREGRGSVRLPEGKSPFKPGPFRSGLARTFAYRREGEQDRRHFYVDRSGNEAFAKGFVSAKDFCHGVAQVSKKYPTRGCTLSRSSTRRARRSFPGSGGASS